MATAVAFPAALHRCPSLAKAARGCALNRTCSRTTARLPAKRSALCQTQRPSSKVAAALADAPTAETIVPVQQLDDAERAHIAAQLGYRSIGKELPDNVTLQDVVRSVPEDVYEIKPLRAWGAVATSIASFAASLWLISVSPWYLLPFAWALAGTAFTGFFVVGHDCGHRSFSKNKLVEDIVGTLMFMPLIYPFEPWRIKHNHHHAHTNKLVEDTAWHPVTREAMAGWSKTESLLYKTFLGSPLKLWASVGHWAIWHFDLKKFTQRERSRVMVSLAAVFSFMAFGWPLMIYYTGLAGWFKFWLMPWLGYHFWMSTFTVVHHTAPHIPFRPAESWNAAKAQLGGTVHCDFPAWVEFLTHDISVHVPHHVSSRIPWYNLRKANESLRKNWGEYMTEASFNWRMVRSICTELHVFDEQKVYVPFDHEKPEPFFSIQRMLMPNRA